MCISASVGRNGHNGKGDVKTIQILINMNINKLKPLENLEEDGICGSGTLDAIETFQTSVAGFSNPDGKVDPGGETLKFLAEGIPSFCERVLKINASDTLIQRYCAALAEKMAAYGIDTPLRMAHFLAQVGHESGELRYCEELASGNACKQLLTEVRSFMVGS